MISVAGGLVYFTEYLGNKVGRLDPSTGVFMEWTIPPFSSGPWGIVVAGGLVYFTEYSVDKVGRLMVDPIATTTVAIAKTFSTATTGSSVSTASTTPFLRTATVASASSSTYSSTQSTTSGTTSISDTVTVEPLAHTYTHNRSGHVGGELTSVNKLVVLAPFLALIAVAAVAVVYGVKRRRNA